MTVEDFRDFIRSNFSARRRDEPALTLTKFASELGMSPQKLNSVLHQGAGLSTLAARKAVSGLKLAKDAADYFVDLVDAAHHRSEGARQESLERARQFHASKNMDVLAVDDFAPIAKWESVAAYVLVETADFLPDITWAASRLGLPVEQTQKIYDQLFSLGFLRIEDGKWICDSFTFNVESKETLEPLRDYYAQLSRQAAAFLDRNPDEKRHFASAVVSIGTDDVDFVRDEIESFRKTLVAKLETRSSKRERVCVLNLQCFPLDRRAP